MENFFSSGQLGYHTLTSSPSFSYFTLLTALDHFISIPYSVHTLVYSCYHGAQEVITLTE
jgi:hypothetical protein